MRSHAYYYKLRVQTCLMRLRPILSLAPLAAAVIFSMGCNQIFGLDQTHLRYPNYYTCRVTAYSGFGIDADVVTTADGDVHKNNPGGPVIGPTPAGSTGTIVGGPGSPSGSNEVWWEVTFSPTLGGWVPEARLEVIGGAAPPVMVQQKELDVCVPVEWNESRPEFDANAVQDFNKDCEDRVIPAFRYHHASELIPGTGFSSMALTGAANEDDSCNDDCSDPTGVCVTMGWDPDPPVPDPISAAVFATTTVCEVDGMATLNVGGHTPKTQPGVRGVLQILGRPCPGGSCQVGVAFKLTGDDIEFDSGTVFAGDPKFVDLSVLGVTEPAAIQFGPFLNCTDCSLGELGPDTLLTTMQGTRPLLLLNLPGRIITFRNTQSVALAVNWVDKTCRFSGDLGGQVKDDDGAILDISAGVELDGVLVNQPPDPDASKTVTTVECTSPQGALVTLDGSRSSDPDGTVAFYVWRHGSNTGPHVADPSQNPIVTTPQGLGQTTYNLGVVDTRFAADDDSVKVSVVDTTAPMISCNAPATITPSDAPEKPKQGISFTATATDVCSGVSQVAVTSFACTKPQSCKVTFAGDTITILDSGGVGDKITWTVSAQDNTGNAGQKTCQIDVIKK